MNEQLVSCPFCNDSDFDLIGLKSHLQMWCEVYDSVAVAYNPMIQGLREVIGAASTEAQDERKHNE